MTHIRIPMTALIALMSLFLFAVTAAQAMTNEKRIALVIGNSEYKHTAPLKNPVNDARAVAAALRRLNFEVVEGTDLDLPGMREKVREYTDKLGGAKVALFYYAGHGFQINGNNHLAPIDATLKNESDIDFETLSLNFILRQMEREKRTNLVFLDACRDNPLATKLSRSMGSQGRSVNMSRGLARVESGIGMLISYATSPGTVALDGEGNHSPYTQALLKYLEKPNLSVSDMMINVRQDVLATTAGKQVPWENSSLTGKYFFKTAAKATVARAQDPARRDESRVSDIPRQDKKDVAEAYRATVQVGTCRAYTIFEEQHGSTFYGRLAKEYIRKNCSENQRTGQEDSQAAARNESASDSEIKIPEPNSAMPDTSGSGTDEADKPETVVAAKTGDTDTAQAPAEEPEDKGALVASIQRELDRLGCDPGVVDGKWGQRTSSAVEAFNREANLEMDSDGPNEALLTVLKAKTGTVCKAPVVTTRPAAPAPRRQAVAPAPKRTAPKPPPVVKKKRAPKEDRYWGGEDTRIECEVKGIWSSDCFTKNR